MTRPQVPWFLKQCSFFYGAFSSLHGTPSWDSYRGEVLTDHSAGGGGAIGIVQKVGRCTRTGEILIFHQQYWPSAKLTCLEAGEVSCLGFYQSPKQWSMRTSAHPNGKESLWAANDAKNILSPCIICFSICFAHPFISDYGAAVFLQTEDDKEACAWVKRNSSPPLKVCGL